MHQPPTSRSHFRAAVRVTVSTVLAVLLAAVGALAAGAGPATASVPVTSADRTAAAHRAPGAGDRCVPIRPESGFYEAGQIGSEELTTPNSRCTTISVSHIRDQADPADRCQTFALGFWPLVDGSLTYTEPVTACGRHRTVLARNVPDNARYIVLYAVDYIDPDVQRVEFRVWH